MFWFSLRFEVHCNHRMGEKYSFEAAHTDHIMCDPLDKVHCDWWSPDNELHLCFNTETVMNMARAKGFLTQPPHFREEADHKWAEEVVKKLLKSAEVVELALGIAIAPGGLWVVRVAATISYGHFMIFVC